MTELVVDALGIAAAAGLAVGVLLFDRWAAIARWVARPFVHLGQQVDAANRPRFKE